MFERFIKNKLCVDIMMWLLNHSVGDYDAAIIAHDVQAIDLAEFTTALYVLDQLEIIDIDNNDPTCLRVLFNEDSVIVQSFRTLRDCFDNEAYRNSSVCGVLADFNLNFVGEGGFSTPQFTYFNGDDDFIDLFIDTIENYKDIEISDDPEIAEKQQMIIEQARELDEAGELEQFINFVKLNRK